MRRVILTSVALFVLVAASAEANVAAGAPMRCEITSKFGCSVDGCAPNKLGVYNLIDIDGRTLSRCDRNGCDTYTANVTRSGAFVVLDVPGRGMLAKLSVSGSEYIEVVTLGTNALVSFGTCGHE